MFLFATVAKVTPVKEVGVNRNIITHLGGKTATKLVTKISFEVTFSWRLNEIPPAAKMVLVESVQTFGWMIQTLSDTEDTVRESAVRKHERQALGLASRQWVHWVRRQWRMILSKMKQQKFRNAKILNHLSIGPKQNYGKDLCGHTGTD